MKYRNKQNFINFYYSHLLNINDASTASTKN